MLYHYPNHTQIELIELENGDKKELNQPQKIDILHNQIQILNYYNKQK